MAKACCAARVDEVVFLIDRSQRVHCTSLPVSGHRAFQADAHATNDQTED